MITGAGPGSFNVDGGSGNDRIRTGRGADRVTAGGGNDRVRSGGGDDSIDVADAQPDVVHCGRGIDSVIADSRDRLAGCEQRTRR